MLVRLLSADDPGVLSVRHWLEGIDAVRIFRGQPGVRLNASTLEVAIDDPYASANHVLVRLTPEGITVQDEGSSNGTYVDGEPLLQAVQVGRAIQPGAHAGGGEGRGHHRRR